tara:strand:+ start:5542 stop:8517 length:2976 start_codon:yes stop_codon:yes gene_type:complete
MINGDVKIEIYKSGSKEEQILGVLDLYNKSNFPLALNYGVKNIISINETTGTYSKTLKIPATKNNNKVLKNIGFDHTINIVSLLDNSVQCRVSLNNNVLVVGSIQVKSIISDTKISDYEITILGSNVSWSKVFADEFMCDVGEDFDNGQTHSWTNGMWKDINDNTILPFNDNVFCLPIICWGEWKKTYNYNGNISKMDLMETRPAYFIKNLITHYFNKAGYEVISNFFNTNAFEKLIIPTAKQDWERTSTSLIDDAKVQAEFNAVGMTGDYSFPNSIGERVKARYVAKEYEGSGAQLFVPFDVEIKDLANSQQIAVHDPLENPFYPNTYLSGGFTMNEEVMVHHKYIVPTNATYNIKVDLSIVRQYHSNCHFEIHLYRDYQNLYTGQAGTNSLSWSPNHTNQLYKRIMLGGMGSPPTEPIVLDSILVNGPTPSAMATEEANFNINFPPGSIPYYEFYEYSEITLESGEVSLEAGDMIMIFAVNDWGATSSWVSSERGKCYVIGEDTPQYMGGFHYIWNYPSAPFKPKKTTFEVTRVGTVSYGDDIYLKDYLPCDIAKIELVKAITGMFNLYWTTDEVARKVYVEPYNDFYKTTKQAVDFSNKIDYSKPQTTKFILDDINRNLYFKYAKDSGDGYVDEIEKQLDQEFHSLRVDLQDGFMEAEEIIGNEITAPTYMINDWELTHNNTGSPRIPLIVGEYIFDIEHSTKPELLDNHTMRILSYEGMQPISTYGWGSWDWQNANSGLVAEYPQASTHHPIDADFENLDYADNSSPGLYTTYWKTFIDKLSDAPRIKIVYMNLEAKDISQLDFTKPVYIDDYGQANGGYWLLHRIIDYKPHNQDSTKVELLQFYGEAGRGGTKKKRKDEKNKIGDGKISVKIGGDGRKNESLVLKSNNDSPSFNGNIMLGSNLRTRKENQIILGQYNVKDDDALFILGGGTSEDDRRNVLVVDSSGTLHLGENGGGLNMVTKDDNGNIIDLYTETDKEVIIKVIKG